MTNWAKVSQVCYLMHMRILVFEMYQQVPLTFVAAAAISELWQWLVCVLCRGCNRWCGSRWSWSSRSGRTVAPVISTRVSILMTLRGYRRSRRLPCRWWGAVGILVGRDWVTGYSVIRVIIVPDSASGVALWLVWSFCRAGAVHVVRGKRAWVRPGLDLNETAVLGSETRIIDHGRDAIGVRLLPLTFSNKNNK